MVADWLGNNPHQSFTTIVNRGEVGRRILANFLTYARENTDNTSPPCLGFWIGICCRKQMAILAQQDLVTYHSAVVKKEE